MTPQEQLIQDVASFDKDPLGFVNYIYPWGSGELEGEAPRKWQTKILKHIGDKLQNPETRFMPIRIAVASGHGIGKSALIGQVIHWAMSTCEDCKVVYTANTEPQLRTKTTPEISKWFRRALNSNWFVATASSFYSVDSKHEKNWRADAVTWSENNTEAFAGLHNKKKRIVVIFDEASAIHDKVWDTTEGALTDEETEIIWIAFGNPTRNTGRFADCFKAYRHLWFTMQIDSRTVEGTNKAQIQEWIDTYGIDSDFVKVRVRGLFPSSGFKQFISSADVDAAFGRPLRDEAYNWAPKIIGVDPAWEGDDEFVIILRQGLASRVLSIVPKNDNDVMMANLISQLEDHEKADAVFIDGGYGTGIVSVGRTLNRDWRLVWFQEKPINEGYLNKRAEMWGNMREWLKSGGAIPKDTVLYNDLIGPETVSRIDGKIQLESKKDMKARGVQSPNRADALAITFAYPVAAKIKGEDRNEGKAAVDYNPLDAN